MESRIRVMLVDDHLLVREGLGTLLKSHSDIEIVAEAGDGLEAVAIAQRVRPDVILMDINMPKMNGLDATRQIKAAVPCAWIIGLSINADTETCAAMLSAGAACHLAKDCNSDALVAAIRKCADAQKASGAD